MAVVEDDPGTRERFVAIIAGNLNMECIGAFGSAEHALRGLPALSPKVILMDIDLPGIDGVECVRQIAPQLPGAKIVMLTVHADANAIFSALAAGASGYLLKPPAAAELLDAILDVFGGGVPLTSFVARKVLQSFQRPAVQPNVSDEYNLTKREREVLQLLVEGLTYKEIATSLGVSYWTVKTHIERIFEKLHVRNRSHAVAKYLTHDGQK